MKSIKDLREEEIDDFNKFCCIRAKILVESISKTLEDGELKNQKTIAILTAAASYFVALNVSLEDQKNAIETIMTAFVGGVSNLNRQFEQANE